MKPKEYCIIIDAQGRQNAINEFEAQQRFVTMALKDERDDLINNLLFWRDCLPDEAQVARQQLNAVIEFIRRRYPEGAQPL